MRFKEPIDVRCPSCERHFFETMKWLMEKGRSCPACGASLENDPCRLLMEEWTNFAEAILFIVEIERHWKITISDEEAIGLTTAESICNHVVEAVVAAHDHHPSRNDVRKFLHDAAGKTLTFEVAAETDVLAGLRGVLLKSLKKSPN